MEENKSQISKRARTAKHVVDLANHMPLVSDMAQSGELRKKLNEREKTWECPEHLQVLEMDTGKFLMEFLTDRPMKCKKEGIILQLHGGGYQGTLHNTYRDMAALYHEVSFGLDVLTIDYRVAPKHPFPAALEDALFAYHWILDHGYDPKDIYFAGDSAGGGLALAMGLYLKDHEEPLPAGIITMSAWTDLTLSGKSYQEKKDIDPLFRNSEGGLLYDNEYYREDDPKNPYISPLFGDFEGFPPMLMQVGSQEMLLDDTVVLAEKAKEAGVLVKQHIYPGMFHVFQMGLLLYPEAKAAWEEVRQFFKVCRNKTN